MGWAGRLAQVEGLLGRRSSWKNRLRLEEKRGMENKTTESETEKQPEVRNGTREGAQREVSGPGLEAQGGRRRILLEAGRLWLTKVGAAGEGRKGGGQGRKEEI